MVNELNYEKFYYDINQPSSYRGINTLLKTFKESGEKVNSKQISKWLSQQKTHVIHSQPIFKFKRNPIVSKYIDHNWNADLIEITQPKENNNYRYILMVIDVLSKYGWAEPLFNKEGATVKRALLKILRESKRKPTILTTDAGREFTNKSLKKYLSWRKIKHLILKDHTKASIVERWNQTIKSKLHKYLSFNKTHKFIDILPQVIKGYNHTIHSRTKFKPIDVNEQNARRVYQNLYKIRIMVQKPIFKIKDKVRVYLPREKFEKGYFPNYSTEIFVVYKVYNTSPYPKYRIKDMKNNIIRGSYYTEELKRV